MALPGFELLYNSAAQQIRSSDDAAIVAVHWNLVSHGLMCCGSGETWSDRQNENHVGSEALPTNWNADSNIYTLRYVDPTSNRTYLMKALSVDGQLILHLVRCFDEKTESTTIRSRDYVNDDRTNMASAFNSLDRLNASITSELCSKIFKDAKSQSPAKSSSSTSNQRTEQPGRSPLMEDPRRGSGTGGLGFYPPQPLRPDIGNPFSVGRADLDPLSGGFGGGMFMDPRNFPRGPTPGGGFGPTPGGGYGPMPPGFPPGSIPPGARFDPVGPPGIPQPDPDHERPPTNYDDMFM